MAVWKCFIFRCYTETKLTACSVGLSVLGCVYSKEAYLNGAALFFGCFCITLPFDCSHTHTPAAHIHSIPHRQLGLRSKRPAVVMGTISTMSALLRPEHSNLPPTRHYSYPSTSSAPLFCIPRQKKIPSSILSLRFIHPRYLALALSSPPTPACRRPHTCSCDL